MISFREFAIQRRAFLITLASFAATLSFQRGSYAAETDGGDRVSRRARPHPNGRESPSDEQMSGAINLKTVGPIQQVASLRYSNHTYHARTVSGSEISFPEFNLRFKTDASVYGPAEGRPVLLPTGMRTDRAFIVFAKLSEIGAFVEHGV